MLQFVTVCKKFGVDNKLFSMFSRKMEEVPAAYLACNVTTALL